MVDCVKNLYEILDVSPYASFDEIKKAYKKLVMTCHPDVNKSADAEIKFKLLNNAYEVLSDEEKRKNYDSLLNIKRKTSVKNIAQNENEFSKEDIKEEIQNEKPDEIYKKDSKNSIIKEVKITEKEAKEGTVRTVNILNTQKCPKCLGKKIINGIKCAYCFGKGQKSSLKKIDVEIKKNVLNDEILYVGKINSSALFDKNLYLKIIIEKPKKLYFEGDDILVHVDIPLYDAILGTKLEINVDKIGLVSFFVPPLTKPNDRIKLDIDYKNQSYYATIGVIFPDFISNEEKKLYDEIRKINKGQK